MKIECGNMLKCACVAADLSFHVSGLSALPGVWRKGLWSWVKRRWWVRGRGSPTEPRTGWVSRCEAPRGDEPSGNPELSGSLNGPGRSNTQHVHTLNHLSSKQAVLLFIFTYPQNTTVNELCGVFFECSNRVRLHMSPSWFTRWSYSKYKTLFYLLTSVARKKYLCRFWIMSWTKLFQQKVAQSYNGVYAKWISPNTCFTLSVLSWTLSITFGTSTCNILELCCYVPFHKVFLNWPLSLYLLNSKASFPATLQCV